MQNNVIHECYIEQEEDLEKAIDLINALWPIISYNPLVGVRYPPKFSDIRREAANILLHTIKKLEKEIEDEDASSERG